MLFIAPLIFALVFLFFPQVYERVVCSEGKKIWVVAIDPGHGGMDNGVRGKRGIREKDVNLQLAIRLEKELMKEGNIRCILTRSKDIDLRNRDRCEIAKRGGAHCFISIHSNGYFSSDARGSIIYYLPFEREEKKREVDKSYLPKKGVEDKEFLNSILRDMKRTQWINESSILARSIQDEMKRIPGGAISRTGQVTISLLSCLEMPGCLIEIGFITNPEDEKILIDPHYRDLTAKAIKNGIMRFLNSYGKED
jgi:N-acetylmuramoyl-L-alanine amidase